MPALAEATPIVYVARFRKSTGVPDTNGARPTLDAGRGVRRSDGLR